MNCIKISLHIQRENVSVFGVLFATVINKVIYPVDAIKRTFALSAAITVICKHFFKDRAEMAKKMMHHPILKMHRLSIGTIVFAPVRIVRDGMNDRIDTCQICSAISYS